MFEEIIEAIKRLDVFKHEQSHPYLLHPKRISFTWSYNCIFAFPHLMSKIQQPISFQRLTPLPLHPVLPSPISWSIFSPFLSVSSTSLPPWDSFSQSVNIPSCHLKTKQNKIKILTWLYLTMVLYFFFLSQLSCLINRERKKIVYTHCLYCY